MNITPREPDPVDKLKRLGGAPFAAIMLDVIGPIAPVLAQGLYAAQPLARLWNGADALDDLARLLEAPDGVDILRRRLLDGEDEEA